MNKFLHNKFFYISIIAILILMMIISLVKIFKNTDTELITAEVSRGDVEYIVSVSGIVEADNTAKLAFPISGKVAEVMVSEGDVVMKGQALVSLEQSALMAEKQNVYASLLIARADKNELINGPSEGERAITNTNVKISEENLVRTVAVEDERVTNAYRALLSANLAAEPLNKERSYTAPIVTGAYTCEKGVYNLDVYSSGSKSGYTYRLSGLEIGTYTAYTETSGALGLCGLFIQFVDGEVYGNSDWIIEIPNMKSDSYITNLNAYNLATQLQENSVSAAKQALELALNKQTLENTAPRDEALQRANANVIKAESNLAVINARIQDHTLTTPFTGSITNINILPGETVTTIPIVTVLANDLFEVTARIPEIDVTKINVGQSANIVFDARVDEILSSKIVFISPLATEIDGVAYFEATIRIDEIPEWLRGGLNSDIDIIVDSRNDVLKIPKRFVTENKGASIVMLLQDENTIETSVDVGFSGNDGFVEITGLSEGDIIVAP